MYSKKGEVKGMEEKTAERIAKGIERLVEVVGLLVEGLEQDREDRFEAELRLPEGDEYDEEGIDTEVN